MRRAIISFVVLLAMPAWSQEGFRPLTGWRAYGGGPLPQTWTIADGLISHHPGGGDIETMDTFGNFELRFEWKISAGGNSGVFYLVDDSLPAPHLSGLEYQILDNAGHPDGKNPVTSAASVYDLYAPSSDLTHPVGAWNSGAIIVRGPHVEHWLNGTKVLEFERGSSDWASHLAASKFAGTPTFGTGATGHIDLQDHGAAVQYRNLLIRDLSAR
ncbi:MAG: hypothetical protein JWN11_318 [Hyphomicrobiales bacterium]|nr:hypothetical protein [Hyphomicrobiales bacterium]